MVKSCENCSKKLNCKAFIDINGTLTNPPFCGKIYHAPHRIEARRDIYIIIGEKCDTFSPSKEANA